VQLDRTEIAIRQRTGGEILDLALRVASAFGGPLLMWTLCLALPWALLNSWLTWPILADEYNAGSVFRYALLMTELIYLEAPLATMATVLFLGRAMFQQPSSGIFRDLKGLAPRILWTELQRGALVGLCLALLLDPTLEMAAAESLLPFVCCYVFIVRAMRPFTNEVVLLERNPLRSSNPNIITVSRRSRALHGPIAGDVYSRSVSICGASIVLTVCLMLSWWFAVGVLTNQWLWGPLMMRVLLPLSLWLTVVYATVARFLSYLDLRIRREGWEVELKVRAAANELKGRAA
jgi:hypothetical protein